MAHTHDVIVLGLGAMGAAACSALARRGVRVLGLERFDLDHPPPLRWGSSGGQSRLIRQAYFEHPDYVPLLRETYQLWRGLEARTNKTLLHETGLLYLGPPDGPLLTGVRQSASAYQIPVDLLDRATLDARWPAFCMPDGWRALFEPGAGYVLAEASIQAMLDDARGNGAELRGQTPVERWRAAADGVEVVAGDGQSHRADHLIVTAGAWARALLGNLGIPLTVTRQVLGWVEAAESASSLPCWAAEAADDSGIGLHYGVPPVVPGPAGLKCGFHHSGREVDPDANPTTVDADERDAMREGLRRYLPEFDGEVTTAHACLYTMSPDGHFVLGPHPREPRVTIATGFSGHGFKFAPVVGEALADFATAGGSERPVGFLSPSRFATREG